MKAERLFRAIGLVDDDLVEETAKAPARKRPSWRRYGAMAACLAVLLLGGGNLLSKKLTGNGLF